MPNMRDLDFVLTEYARKLFEYIKGKDINILFSNFINSSYDI